MQIIKTTLPKYALKPEVHRSISVGDQFFAHCLAKQIISSFSFEFTYNSLASELLEYTFCTHEITTFRDRNISRATCLFSSAEDIYVRALQTILLHDIRPLGACAQ